MTTETVTEPQSTSQEFVFQAEIKRLLHLLSHSLYQNREIAIRELISNASDAIDKFRHLALLDTSLADGDELAIDLWPDKDTLMLSIRDNGVGMTRDELVKNLGTIAHSGSLEFLANAKGDKQDLSLIGQFGVGFYSAFMLADKVEVLSRSYKEDAGWMWESDGSGQFTVRPAEVAKRGTEIRLHLKEELDEFSRAVRLQWILRQYSGFITYPIRVNGELVNDQKPIWCEPKSQVTAEQYNGLYKFLSKRGEDAMWHLHLSLDSPFQFHTVLFCPQQNDELLGLGKSDQGLHLCAKRVLVQNDCDQLLPSYLRFLMGIVDSADLPLNVSREALQDNNVFRKIRKVLTKKVLGHLDDLSKNDEKGYAAFYLQFGPVMREGVSQDFENKDAVSKLMRFKSSYGDDRTKLSGLEEYVSRLAENQNQIYYVGGPDLRTIEKNPNLDGFKARGLEVLYMTDPVDEFVINNLNTFQDRLLVSIDSDNIELPEPKAEESSEQDPTKPAGPDLSEGFGRVIELFKQAIGDKVKDVRASNRLTGSVACLVAPEGTMSAQLEKVLRAANDDFPLAKRTLELNPNHPLMKQLVALSASADNVPFIQSCGSQILSNLLILDGMMSDPHDVTDRVLGFMEELAQQRSSVVSA